MEVPEIKKYVQYVGVQLRSDAFFVRIALKLLAKFAVGYKIDL